MVNRREIYIISVDDKKKIRKTRKKVFIFMEEGGIIQHSQSNYWPSIARLAKLYYAAKKHPFLLPIKLAIQRWWGLSIVILLICQGYPA